MRIEKRSMGWIQKPSAYQYNQQLNAKRKSLAQTYLNQQSALATTMFAAQDNLVAGTVENTYKSLIEQAKLKAKTQAEQMTSSIDSLIKTA